MAIPIEDVALDQRVSPVSYSHAVTEAVEVLVVVKEVVVDPHGLGLRVLVVNELRRRGVIFKPAHKDPSRCVRHPHRRITPAGELIVINFNIDVARDWRARGPGAIRIPRATTRLDIADDNSLGGGVVFPHGGSLNAYAGHAHVVALNLEQDLRMVGDGQEGPRQASRCRSLGISYIAVLDGPLRVLLDTTLNQRVHGSSP